MNTDASSAAQMVDDMTARVRREREAERVDAVRPENKRLMSKYRVALRSINLLSEREARELLREAATPQV